MARCLSGAWFAVRAKSIVFSQRANERDTIATNARARETNSSSGQRSTSFRCTKPLLISAAPSGATCPGSNAGSRIRNRREEAPVLDLPVSETKPQPLSRTTVRQTGAISQFERRLIQERTKAGLAAARARGRNGGRPPINPGDPKVTLAKKLH